MVNLLIQVNQQSLRANNTSTMFQSYLWDEDFIANKLCLWQLCRGCVNDTPFLVDADNAGRLFYPMDPI